MTSRYVTKAVEHDLCAAIDHVLLHRSRTSHSCKCGYRTVWGSLESGDCPECDETIAFEKNENMKQEQSEISLKIQLGLLQAAATIRSTGSFTDSESVRIADRLLNLIRDLERFK
jgi:hypothetical protein